MNKKILIVDDDPSVIRLLTKFLATGGYEVLSATNGAEAMRVVFAEGPPIVVTDWVMPEMDGLELCRTLRSADGVGFVYIIMLTVHTDRDRLVEAFEAGADDYVTKPIDARELLARLNPGVRILRLEDDLAKQNRTIRSANAELAVLNHKLERMATTDELTGLANRRQAMIRLEEEWAASKRYDERFSCIVLDIDHFKHFNDTYGHAIGDRVLRGVAQALNHTSRACETVCRVGGEEFLVLCPRTDVEMGIEAAERLRRAVEANAITLADQVLRCTISGGVAERDESIATIDDLLRNADEALYAAKGAGRNRICSQIATAGS